MRYLFFYLLAGAASVSACQPVTPASVKSVSPTQKMSINDTALLTPQTSAKLVLPASNALPTLPALSTNSIPSEKSSSNNVDKNSEQIEIDPAINTNTSDYENQNRKSQKFSKITPRIAARKKTFDPTKIMGFEAPTLVINLGKANMIRHEGPIEVWQYQFTSCVVDFFFFPTDKAALRLIAKSWDMRSSIMGINLNRDGCRAEMNSHHRQIKSE